MDWLKKVLEKISARSTRPVVRVRGWRASTRVLTIYLPGQAGPSFKAIPLHGDALLDFKVREEGGAFVVEGSRGEIAALATKEEAQHLLAMIAAVVSPSMWSYFKKFLILWFIYWAFTPSSTPPSHYPVRIDPHAAYTQPIPPVPQQAQLYAPPAPVIADRVQKDEADPFGLRMVPDDHDSHAH